MAIAFLQHTPVGKTTQAQPFTAMAHARYIMGKNKAVRVFSENMPRQWHAVQRFLKEREDGIRKNGRVCDKFIIGVPVEFSQDAAESVLRRWARRIGKGKAPVLFAFHWNAVNPHAHAIFIDADPETGKRVFGTSDKGSTALLKLEWEAECNAMFKELGIEAQIVFGAPPKEIANENTPDLPDVVVSDASPTLAAEADVADIPEVDESVVDIDPAEARIEVARDLTPADLRAEALDIIYQQKNVHSMLERIAVFREDTATAQLRLDDAGERLREAQQEAGMAEQAAAQAREALNTHLRESGSLKGFKVEVFGFSFTSPARKAAEAAQERATEIEAELRQAIGEVAVLTREYQVREQMYNRVVAEYEQLQGTEKELREAVGILANSVREYAKRDTSQGILAAYASQEITGEDAALLLNAIGKPQEAQRVRADKSYGD